MNQKSYVKHILRKLKCSGDRKREIRKEIESDIASFVADGQDMEQIIKQMGQPSEVAREFNENFSEKEIKAAKKKKIVIIVAAVCLFVIMAGCAIYSITPKYSEVGNSSVYKEDELHAKTEKIVDLMDHDQYQTIIDDYFVEDLKKAISIGQLQLAKSTVGIQDKQNSGIIQFATKQIDQLGKKYAVVEAAVSYENKNIIYTLSFDSDYKLVGFYMK